MLATAGDGVLALGMRLCAFQLSGRDLVLRHYATSHARAAVLERRVGRSLRGLRAPLADHDRVRDVDAGRRIVYREDHDLFDRFVRHVGGGGFDPAELEASP